MPRMDTTQVDELLRDLASAEAADAAVVADAVADLLEDALEHGPRPEETP